MTEAVTTALATTDVVAFVANLTASLEEDLSSTENIDSAEVITTVASFAEVLNDNTVDDAEAAAVRSELLSIMVDVAASGSSATENDVTQQASALVLLVDNPKQVGGNMTSLALRFAGAYHACLAFSRILF